MIFEELIEPSPADTARLIAQQERDRAARNADALLRWYVATFGPTVGPVSYTLDTVDLRVNGMRQTRSTDYVTTGYDVMHSVACIGIDEAIRRAK